ncbi:MAG: tRNA lysidine(34) synthetase TilS [Pseudomonadota bacterium]
MSIFQRFKDNFSKLHNTNDVAIAVSGGSDSLALCFLVKECLDEKNLKTIAFIVNHNLREESLKEAQSVKNLLDNCGFEVHIIDWEGIKPTSNIQEAARLARYKLLTDFCHKNNITYLATGHQQNDQAENFIIRAEHGAGVYGLSGIPETSSYNGITLIRPLLNFTKEELQNYLKHKNIKWIEDPSNNNERFARVRARNFLKQFPKWAPRISQISKNLSNTKEAIDFYVNKEIDILVRRHESFSALKLNEFNQLPQEIRFRIIAKILQEVGNNSKPARAERIERLLNKIQDERSFKASTLSGCLIKRKKEDLIFSKEI